MSALDAAQRATLAALADRLIPREGTMPSGSEADAHGEHLDRVFAVRPDLVDAVHRALDAIGDPAAVDPAAPGAARPAAEALTAAYFLNPEVARLVGYRRRSAIPIRFDTDLDALIAPVSGRGPIYRPTPRPEED